MRYTHKVVHIETGVTVGRFESEQAAQYWLDHLGVVPEYKARCYRIRRIEVQS